jgi:hypothetical protein
MSHKISKLWIDSNNTNNSLETKEIIKNRIDKDDVLKKQINLDTEWELVENQTERIGSWSY